MKVLGFFIEEQRVGGRGERYLRNAVFGSSLAQLRTKMDKVKQLPYKEQKVYKLFINLAKNRPLPCIYQITKV